MATTLIVDTYYMRMDTAYSFDMPEELRQLDRRMVTIQNLVSTLLSKREQVIVFTDDHLASRLGALSSHDAVVIEVVPEVALSVYGGGLHMWKDYFSPHLSTAQEAYVWTAPRFLELALVGQNITVIDA